jgi:pseudoazurin
MKTFVLGFAAVACMTIAASPAAAKQWQVQMLNKGSNGQMMAFEPAFLKIAPGDSVKFVATAKGHNAETIAGMLPAGAAPFKGKVNEEIEVTFTKAGLYGYKCLPHLGLGMVGLIEVGNASNKAAIASQAGSLPGLSKKVMTGLVAQAK